jgi:PAS domain S-box-containing protein
VAVPVEHRGDEVKRLQRCINDLVSILGLPAMWTGGEPSQIVSTLLDALLGSLGLNLIYFRFKEPVGAAPIEMVRVAPWRKLTVSPREIGEMLNQWLGDDPQQWPSLAQNRIGDTDLSIVPLALGLQGEVGLVVAGSERGDFPRETERLLLGVAVNQAAIALQEARLLNEQKRLANELDRRVAQRTAELAAANEELRLQVGLLQHIPVAAWTVGPDGTPDFVNQIWLEYTGQALDYVQSNPTAWMTAMHPEDRESASRSLSDGIRSGEGFTMEARFRRAHDGTYRWHLNRAVPLRDMEGKILRFVGTSTDIEDLKQSQENLRKTEEQTRLIIDTALDAVITIDADGKITSWNRQAEIVFGWSNREAIGRRLADTIIPERQRMDHARGLRRFLATGDGPILRRRIEVAAVRRSGLEFPVELEVVPMRLGHEWVFSAFIRDITDSKLAQEKLRESELNLREMTETIPAMLWSATPEGAVDYCNARVLDYSGFLAGEILGNGWTKLLHPDDVDQTARVWMSSISSGTAYRVEVRTFHAADRTYRWCLTSALPLLDEQGQILKWHGTIVDVHDWKQAQEKLRRSEAFLAEAQHLSSVGSFTCRFALDEFTWSDELYRIYEIDPVVPLTLELIVSQVHPDDVALFQEMVDRARAGLSDFEFEARLMMPDHSVKYLHFIVHGPRAKDGQLEYFGAIQDVTQRRLAEEALGKARAELTHVARVSSLGALTASIAHEVNQPLAGIMTNASTCVRMLAADPPNSQIACETARYMIRDAERASNVIKRLRALFAKRSTAAESVDLNVVTREVVALSLSELQRGRVILSMQLAEGLPLITGDRVQLQQVILNLLLNAAEAMSGVDDRPRELLIRTEAEQSDRVRLTVQDAGVGFEPRDMSRLFEAFYTTKSSGMGIGLSVSRSIIESHNGQLWAVPNDGPGATFSFSIPCEPESPTGSHNLGAIRTQAVSGQTPIDIERSA